MSDLWKIECAGRWVGLKTFAELGLEVASFRKASRVPDTMELSRVALVDSPDLLQWKDWVIVWRGETRVFAGNVTQLPKSATDSSERGSYEISGPRWWMSQVPAIAAWSSNEADPEETLDRSRIIYDPGTLLAPKKTGQFARDIIDAAIAAGIPIQRGTILDGFQTIRFVTGGTTWADALDTFASWHPDSVEHFDYSTSPPTIHITRRGDMASIELALGNADSPESVALQPRYDLRPDRIRFVNWATQASEVFGTTRILDEDVWDVVEDPAPPIREMLIDLGRRAMPQGQEGQLAATWLAQRVRTRTIPQTAGAAGVKEWWVDHIQGLAIHKDILDLSKLFVAAADAKVELEAKREDGVVAHHTKLVNDGIANPDPINPNAVPAPGATAEDYPRELLDGTIEDWMGVRTAKILVKASLGYQAETIEAIANEGVRNDFKALFPRRFKIGDKTYYYNTFSVQCTGTNAQTKVYRAPASATYTPPSSTPESSLMQSIELAKNYAEAFQQLHWSGSITFKGAEVGANEFMGKVINITGGELGWATMNSLVQGVDMDIETGTTTVQVGPPDQAQFTALEDQEAAVPESTTVTYDYAVDQNAQASAAGGFATAAFTTQAQSSSIPIVGPSQLTIQRVRHDGATPKITFAAATFGECNEDVGSLDHPITVDDGIATLDGETEIDLTAGTLTDFWLRIPTDERGAISGNVTLLRAEPGDAQTYIPPSPEGTPRTGVFKLKVYTVTPPAEVGGVWIFKPGTPIPVWQSYRWVGENIGEGDNSGNVYKWYNAETRKDEFRSVHGSGDVSLEEDGEACRVKVIQHPDYLEILAFAPPRATAETPP